MKGVINFLLIFSFIPTFHIHLSIFHIEARRCRELSPSVIKMRKALIELGYEENLDKIQNGILELFPELEKINRLPTSMDKVVALLEAISKKIEYASFFVSRIPGFYSYNFSVVDLNEILKFKRANCLGCVQLFYVLGTACGLKIKMLSVDLIREKETATEGGFHIVSLIELDDGNCMIVDPASTPLLITEPFKWRKVFERRGNIWLLKKPSNLPYDLIQVLDPMEVIACRYKDMADKLLTEGNLKEAEQYLKRALEIAPMCEEVYIGLAMLHLYKGEADKVLHYYNKLLEINPYNYTGLTNRANLYITLGDLEKARADLTKAYQINPDFIFIYLNRGIIYFKQRRIKEALNEVEKGIKLMEDVEQKLPHIYFLKAILKFELGEQDEALALLRYGKSLQPNIDSSRLIRDIMALLGLPQQKREELLALFSA